jgi:hypothetical protein
MALVVIPSSANQLFFAMKEIIQPSKLDLRKVDMSSTALTGWTSHIKYNFTHI